MKDSFLNASGGMSTDTLSWIDGFRARHGRPPRVLHIGNIANNAYNNAKILNAAGIDSDVICYDYYHIMGCPEWEDADFEAPDIDHFKPDWAAIDLKGFQRPRWFAQGPQQLCIDYLIAKRTGDSRRADILWQRLGYINGTAKLRDTSTLSAGIANFVTRQKERARRVAAAFLARKDAHVTIWNKLGRLAAKYGGAGFLGAALVAPVMILLYLLGGAARFVLSTYRQFMRAKRFLARKDALPAAWAKLGQLAVRYGPAGFALGAVIAPFVLFGISIAGLMVRGTLMLLSGEQKNCSVDDFNFYDKIQMHVQQFSDLYPERADKLVAMDILPYSSVISKWHELFKHYDIVQGYSTDGIYPMLAEKRPYFAYEHGTIREIPFQDNGVSRLTALSYRVADGSFVTNTDNVAAATKLRLPEDRTYYLPHAFDYRKLHRFAGAQLFNRARNRVFRIFSPCRQHWVDNDPGWAKGNDRLIRALPILAAQGSDFVVEMVEWGHDLDASKRLVAELGVERYVQWLPQMQKKVLWEKYLTADVVVDQFVISVISGVTFEALSLGCPVITADDGISNRKFFGVPPPIFGCWTPEQIADAIRSLMESEVACVEIGKNSIEWVKKYHSPERMIDIQVMAYKRSIS